MTKNTITPFGLEVKRALKEKGMTQGDLAEKLGITKQYLYNILYGKRPGSKYLPMIAKICGITMFPDSTATNKAGEPCEDTPFGVRVSEALERNGMKQVDLAREVGTSKQYLYMILHGQRSGAKYLEKIALICGIELDSDLESEISKTND